MTTYIAKLFMNGRSQALRLPKEFRFEGDEVYIRKQGDEVIISSIKLSWDTFFDTPSVFGDDFLSDREDSQPQNRDFFDAILVTNNLSEFRRVPDLTLARLDGNLTPPIRHGILHYDNASELLCPRHTVWRRLDERVIFGLISTLPASDSSDMDKCKISLFKKYDNLDALIFDSSRFSRGN